MTWAAQNDTGLIIELTPKGVVFSFLFLFLLDHDDSLLHPHTYSVMVYDC